MRPDDDGQPSFRTVGRDPPQLEICCGRRYDELQGVGLADVQRVLVSDDFELVRGRSS